ncbi:alpha/beta hydrolase [Micromonospora sp. NBC_01813]|uniref:alpha/beta hydrolase n=1 Tax=Micromonospora sp. NBC_01813 TaxID=2975988 RepID=UPI002DD98A74|nr:alpha/beta hydrolase-fold protein [Micromonospora sp. NBC_01813]WSA07628.1 alpha/beta hydrolase-fold protein [Micromonospora sp. NBC_01813]
MPFRHLPVDQSDVRYLHGPDSLRLPGVPAGRTIEFDWADSAVYPGTARKFWVHLPAQYDPSRPAALLVFQDGWWNLDPAGEVRAALVLDNLIHKDDLPPMVGLFVDPGSTPDFAGGGPGAGDSGGRGQRNVEYDAFDDRYANLLLGEIIPQVRQHFLITDDPDQWGICGISSGGNCAFTVAWLRPDRFRRVLCCLSSFAQMPGGNPYPELLGSTPGKSLRIFLQAGHRDINWNEPEHNWLASNLRVAAALTQAGYDFRLVLGDGGHNPNHPGVLLPDALRWLWRPPDPG